MAAGFFALLRDVTTMTKVAVSKATGVVGDDLAVSAQQMGGIPAHREIPAVLRIARGSLVNKALLITGLLPLSVFFPAAVMPILSGAALFLCYEGVEKSLELAGYKGHAHEETVVTAATDPKTFEDQAVKKAILTDALLSAEIIMIALGTVVGAPFLKQLGTLCGVAIVMTGAVTLAVTAIVKMDDVGYHWVNDDRENLRGNWKRKAGELILKVAPPCVNALPYIGTAAMFMVGGGILLHAFPAAGVFMHGLSHAAGSIGGGVITIAAEMAAGVVAGICTLGAVEVSKAVYECSQKDIPPLKHKKELVQGPEINTPSSMPTVDLKQALSQADQPKQEQVSPVSPVVPQNIPPKFPH